MSSNELYPQDDDDVLTLVRGLTLYEDSEDEIPKSTLETQRRIAKMRLKTKTGDDSWFTNDGLGQALIASTAILAKSALENYSITSWDLGVGTIDVSGAGDTDNAQFEQWAQMAAEGLAKGGYTTNTATNINSASYIN